MKQIFTILFALSAVSVSAVQTTLWTGDKPISWNSAEYAGEQFDTHNDSTIHFDGLQAEDTILVAISDVESGAQFALDYKGGTNWAWTSLDNVVVNADSSQLSYVVADDTIAAFIAQRGMVVKGIRFHARSIVLAAKGGITPITPDTTTTPVDSIVPMLPGEARVIWTGNETLAWNEVAAQPAEIAALLGENDQIHVTVSAKGTAEWPKVLLRDTASQPVGDDILLNDVTEFPYVAVFTLSAAHVAAMQGGFRLCGDGVTVTEMAIKKFDPNDNPGPGTDTTAIDLSSMYEKVLWTGEKHISWNSEEYAGEQFDTYSLQQDLFAGLAAGHVIVVAVQPDGEAQYSLQYKAGDEWSWTDVEGMNTATEGIVAYRVPSDEMAQLIADRGLVIQGIRFIAKKISLYAETEWESALINVKEILNAQRYNVLGQPVGADYKGIVIQNGKKFLVQ